jgi:hypothetical protein
VGPERAVLGGGGGQCQHAHSPTFDDTILVTPSLEKRKLMDIVKINLMTFGVFVKVFDAVYSVQ